MKVLQGQDLQASDKENLLIWQVLKCLRRKIPQVASISVPHSTAKISAAQGDGWPAQGSPLVSDELGLPEHTVSTPLKLGPCL